MDLTKDALLFITGQAQPKTATVAGFEFTDRNLHVVTPPHVECIRLTTLSGFSDLLAGGFEAIKGSKDVFLHVENPTRVSLIAKASNQYAQRIVYAVSEPENTKPFSFGHFYEPEEFIIALAALFVPGAGDTDYLTNMASHLTSESAVKAEDNGISQMATVRRGVALAEQVPVKARVTLAPDRTFREAEQPASEFIFRLRSQKDAPPTCALFEADGGKWRLDAITNIATYLSRNSDGITVIS